MASVLTVELGSRSYPINFLARRNLAIPRQIHALAKAGRVSVLLTDAGVAQAQAKFIQRRFAGIPQLAVTAGEKAKSLEVFGQVLEFLAAHKASRDSVLWVVGGGVMGDLGGFAAASYLRGIDFFQVPTTLLAMVDSSVGGKTGINLAAGKNLAGAFHQPRGVFIDPGLLVTLPAREFAAGTAEVIKYSLLGDAALFKQLERVPLTAASANLAAVIRRCCALKARIVAADEREVAPDGGRALLNLGHTFAHAIEQVAGYGTYLHGEAVAIGLGAAARLSEKLGSLSAGEVKRIDAVISAHALPVRLRAPLAAAALLAAMARDKKVRAGLPRFVVLQQLGEAVTRSEGITPALVKACFREVGAADSL